MNKENLEKYIKNILIEKDRAVVISISGDWGVGKTYFWKNFAENKLANKQTFVYISLFGKEHYKDILEEIVFKLFGKDNQKTEKISLIASNIFSYIAKVISGGAINLNLNPQAIFSLLKKDDFSNIVICFDDIERLSHKLDIRDFLGFLSQLKEDKHCKVVLMLNQNQLNSSHARYFDKFAEKTIDINLRYEPSIEDSFEIANKVVKDNMNNTIFEVFKREIILETFKKINLNNIRIMIYILEALSDFAEELQKIDELNEKLTNELLDNTIGNLAYLKVFGDSEIRLEFNRYEELEAKKAHVNFNQYNSIFASEHRTLDEEKEYLEIKNKFPNFIKYKNLLKTKQYQSNDFIKTIRFYYENSYIPQNDIDNLKDLNIKNNIDKAIKDFFEVNVLLTDCTISMSDNFTNETYRRFEKMYSYKDNVYLYKKIASYNEGFSSIENIIKVFGLDLTNLSLNLNNFYQIIFNNINSLQIDNETRNKLLAEIFISNPQNNKIQKFKQRYKDKKLNTRDILLNTENETEDEHLERINTLTKNDIKEFIRTNKDGLNIVLEIETGDTFKKNREEAFKDLLRDDENFRKRLQFIYKMKRMDSNK